MTDECVRLRKVQAAVLDEYIVHARTARQRLFFESLKSCEQKQPSLTRRGWRDEPFAWGPEPPPDDSTQDVTVVVPPPHAAQSAPQAQQMPQPTPPPRRPPTWRSPPASPRARGPVTTKKMQATAFHVTMNRR